MTLQDFAIYLGCAVLGYAARWLTARTPNPTTLDPALLAVIEKVFKRLEELASRLPKSRAKRVKTPPVADTSTGG